MSRRTSRRRADPGSLTVISWIDIPAQVTATRDGESFKWLLDQRFQMAIDRAAAFAGKTETQAYVAEWRREKRSITGDLEVEAKNAAAQLEAEFPKERLEAIVRAGGIDPEATTRRKESP